LQGVEEEEEGEEEYLNRDAREVLNKLYLNHLDKWRHLVNHLDATRHLEGPQLYKTLCLWWSWYGWKTEDY
jgi:hypothetical protein